MTDASDSAQPDHCPALSDFGEWVRNPDKRTKCYTVTTGPETRSHDTVFNADNRIQSNSTTNRTRTLSHEFISISSIRKVLKPTRIRLILQELFPDEPSEHHAVEKRCLVGFCILLSIQRGKYVRELLKNSRLWDTNLPFEGPAAHLPPNVWKQFLKAQWLFTPAQLLPFRTKYPEHMRLPYLEKELIGKGGSALLYKVTVHSDYDAELKGSQHTSDVPAPTPPRLYALKVYKSEYALKDYTTEVNSFERLRQREVGRKSPPGLIGYYGAYEQAGTFSILLEYGDGGSLYDFLRREDPPTTGKGLHEFWSQILSLLEALSRIHDWKDVDERSNTSQRYQGTHHDIHPGNIVLVRNRTSLVDDVAQYTFKLADLGHTQFVERGDGDREIDVVDPQGGRTYASPESYRLDDFAYRSRLNVTPKADVFSLGCVLLTVAVWIVHGSRGLRDFHQARLKENEQSNGDADYRFHNAHHTTPDLLEAVKDRIQSLPKDMRSSDRITGPVLDKLISQMLQTDPNERPTAMALRANMLDLLKSAKNNLAADLHGTSVNSHESADFTRQDSPIQARSGPSGSMFRGNVRSPNSPIFPDRFVASPRGTMIDTSLPSQSIAAVNPADGTRSPLTDADFWATGSSLARSNPDYSSQPFTGMDAEGRPRSDESHIGHSQHGSLPMMEYIPSTPTQRLSDDNTDDTPESPLTTRMQALQTSPSNPRRLSASGPLSLEGIRRRSRSLIAPVSVGEILEWKRQRQRHMGINKFRVKDNGLINVRRCKTWLKERDHIFLIDDSHSMTGHWIHVKDTFEALSYIVKECDPDGFDVHFTCSEASLYRKKSTKDILMELGKHKKSAGGADIQRRLSDVLIPKREALINAHRKRSITPPRPVSIYVLTDGVWAQNGDAKTPILETIKTLEDSNQPRTAIGISFISFGNSQEALQRLRELDDMVKSAAVNLDIVDTTRFDGNVWKMLMGAIDDHYDENESEPS